MIILDWNGKHWNIKIPFSDSKWIQVTQKIWKTRSSAQWVPAQSAFHERFFSPHIFVCNINTLKIVKICISFHYYLHTDGQESLNTLKVKYLNDLLSIQISEQDMDAVTFFSVGDLFCIHLDTKYANFQEKMPKLFIVVTLLQ